MNRRIPHLVVAVALISLLFLPALKASAADRLLARAQDFAHFPVFAAFTFLLLRGVAARDVRRHAAVLVGAAAVSIVVEVLQPFAARSAEPADVITGFAGIACGALVHASLGEIARRRRTLLAVGALLLLCLAALPPATVVLDRRAARRSFPLLASFESNAELGRWIFQGCRAWRTTEHATLGRYALEIEVGDGDPYPGLFLADMPRDWSGMAQCCFDAFLPGTEPVALWVRADDRPDPAYGERFQAEVVFRPGSNSVCIARDAMATTSGGGPLDLGHVLAWGVFFERSPQGRRLVLDNVRLVPAVPPAL
ncbi:MAG: hypothetical protein JXB04_11950 [Kiritimatiellae bacterium]|nr:hypothetical protein [Kiritimatiellia bacterium]